MNDVYRTVRAYTRTEMKEKGSRFIGHIFPAPSREKAEQYIASIRKEYYDATHNCSAYRLGFGDQALFYYDDDGEPAGTAGRPMYQALTSAGLTNTLILVTRYFGGTKLGTGGLARAYGSTASLTIRQAEIIEKIRTDTIRLQTSYQDISGVMRTIELFHASILEQEYGEGILLTVAVRMSQADEFRQNLVNNTAGRIQFVSPS